jgi:hypothetical protein
MLKKKSGLRTSEVFAAIHPNGVSSLMIEDVWAEKQAARSRVFGRYSIDSTLGLLWTLAARVKRRLKIYYT